MTAPDLPAELKAALEAKLQGLSRNAAAERASLISQTYRDGGGSAAIRSEADALAYALARMPATYAAVSASLNALREIRPDFAPTSLLDVGAGPATATWAAAEAFPSLTSFALLDANSALRALALIFAVFLTNPSPICVLDEVDAPLDDHNVERFCTLLHEMTAATETRFIIITHNPITMARMNRLFGVTMAERGVSQLVSVDLEDAVKILDQNVA